MKLTTRLQLSAKMFLNLFIWGSWFVTVGTHLKSIPGITDVQVGIADWKSIWLVPAFLVFLIFALFFRDRKKIAASESEVELALAHSPVT